MLESGTLRAISKRIATSIQTGLLDETLTSTMTDMDTDTGNVTGSTAGPAPLSAAPSLYPFSTPSSASPSPIDERVSQAVALCCGVGRWPATPGFRTGEAHLNALATAGGDAIREVAMRRCWHHGETDWRHPAPPSAQWGGLVAAAERFDSVFFGISAAETEAMDPQQRLLLEVGYAAIHGATKRWYDLLECDVGIVVGLMNTDFADVRHTAKSPVGLASSASIYLATGSQLSIAAGRLGFALGTQGPCVSVDTACSSALVAINIAMQSMQSRATHMAIAAAANLLLLPRVSLLFSAAGMLSADGRCKTFDARANGYVRAEGVGATTLLDVDAGSVLRMDTLIGGCVVRADGKSASLTAPNGTAQARMLRMLSILHLTAYSYILHLTSYILHLTGTAQSRMLSAAVDCSGVEDLLAVEAHGTGTALGDPTEVGAYVTAQRATMDSGMGPCMAGIKASLGHTEPAAGLVGLLVLTRSRAQNAVASNAKLRVLNPLINPLLQRLRAHIPAQGWQRKGDAVTGVSSFGYSGTIAHAVLMSIRSPGLLEEITSPDLLVGGELPLTGEPLLYHAISYRWYDAVHPFSQHRLKPSANDGHAVTFRSPAAGSLHALVAQHIVQGRVTFPAAGYLEMMRAAAMPQEAALHGVLFLQPLTVEGDSWIDCIIRADGSGEVCGGVDQAAATDAVNGAVYSSCSLAAQAAWRRTDEVPTRASVGVHATETSMLYVSLDAVGLQYGPGYRTLAHVWADKGAAAAARLQPRWAWHGTAVHPADLDDALCVAIASSKVLSVAHLPFAVEGAQLQKAHSRQWVVCARAPRNSSSTTSADGCLCMSVFARRLQPLSPARRAQFSW